MTYRLAPLLVGLTLAAVSCSEESQTTSAPGKEEIVRFSVPKLDD